MTSTKQQMTASCPPSTQQPEKKLQKTLLYITNLSKFDNFTHFLTKWIQYGPYFCVYKPAFCLKYLQEFWSVDVQF